MDERIAQLEEKLRRLPDAIPPDDLRDRVMVAIGRKQKRPGFWHRCLHWLTERPTPMRWAATCASLILAFALGTQSGPLFSSRHLGTEKNGFPVVDNTITTSDEASFYLGRSLLAAGKPKQALEAFRRAALLDPNNPDYLIWQGAAYYALGDLDRERISYQQVIHQRPDDLVARINLANNLLQSRQLGKAGQIYEQILELEPLDKTALYNRALVLHLQGQTDQERQAWKRFLFHYRTGTWANRALEHLHELGDFSFRAYQVGYRRIILNQDLLLGLSPADRDREINYLVRAISRMNLKELNLVVFRDKDPEKARQVARLLRQAIARRLSRDGKEKTIRISWFGEPETLTFAGQNIQLDASVLIFGTPSRTSTKEARI